MRGTRERRVLALALGVVLAAGCDALPGRPDPAERWERPGAVTSFPVLYAANCAGCHGPEGRGGAARGLADAVFLAIADDAALRRATAQGIAGTAMPAFARHAGGTLTDDQIDALVAGMRAWSNPTALRGAVPPPYAGPVGDAERGARTFATACAPCHGATGTGGSSPGSIVDGAYLALVSDQGLRTTVIAGRPDLGHPDWRGVAGGTPLDGRDAGDLVAWLATHRTPDPGAPYPVRRAATP